jgi:hypothetical protein
MEKQDLHVDQVRPGRHMSRSLRLIGSLLLVMALAATAAVGYWRMQVHYRQATEQYCNALAKIRSDLSSDGISREVWDSDIADAQAAQAHWDNSISAWTKGRHSESYNDLHYCLDAFLFWQMRVQSESDTARLAGNPISDLQARKPYGQDLSRAYNALDNGRKAMLEGH